MLGSAAVGAVLLVVFVAVESRRPETGRVAERAVAEAAPVAPA